MEGAGAKASRLFLQRFSTFFESLPIPADASGAYRPDPQATTKPAPGPPSLKGYADLHFSGSSPNSLNEKLEIREKEEGSHGAGRIAARDPKKGMQDF